MTRARSTLLAAAVTAFLMLPPLSQRVLAPSDEARFVTGQVLVIDGGKYMPA